jgi:chromosome segregation ATPase
MPNPSLTSLKSKKLQAQKDLNVILKVTESKRVILEDILLQIKTAEKVLDDNFSQLDLELTQKHSARADELEVEGKKIGGLLGGLKDKERTLREAIEKLENRLAGLNLALGQKTHELRSATQEVDKLKTLTGDLRSDETRLKNSIDELRAKKKTLEDDLSTQTDQNHTTLSAMRNDRFEEQTKLDSQIETARTELRELQQLIQLHTNKRVEQEEEYKRKDNDLIQRENALTIKTKALAKERQEFETESRRWNVIRPVAK